MRGLLLVALTLLASCIPQRQWRTQPLASNAEPEERFVIPPDATKNRLYSLAFVEFRNNGDLWDKRQLEEALHAIDEADRRSNHHALVVTFIHGWKNNARQVNNNVFDLRRQLNRIAADACQGSAEHCGVVGVYLAWSGDLVSRDWNTLRTMSYFDRRGVAAHVASVPIGDALFAVMKQVKLGPERDTNQSVVVGHSFGGLILEYAIAKRMKTLGEELHAELGRRTTSASFKLKALDDFADLVVLINQAAPAAEAVKLLSQYRHDLRQVNLLKPPVKRDCPAGSTLQDCKELTRPLILSVSSTADLATRAVLPVAETIAPPKDRPRSLPDGVELPKGLDAKKVFTTAAAHTPQLQSHELIRCQGEDCSPCLAKDKFYIPVRITLPAYAPGNATKQDQKINYCLVRIFRSWNRTPYWIFQIPAEVVPNHGDIFTNRFTDFLTAFLPPLEQFRQGEPPAPQRQRFYPTQEAATATTSQR